MNIEVMERDIEVYQLVDSTNTIAQRIATSAVEANAPIPHGKVIIAEQQSAGQGRHGRSFFSPPGHGIYMSFILNPKKLSLQNPALATCFAAVAVCVAIEEVCKVSSQIKWVNDLFFEGKKICGISAQANDTMDWIVLGIGINVSLSPEMPDELRDIVGAIYENKADAVSRCSLVDAIIEKILCENLSEMGNVIEEYRKRLFILGKRIRVEGAKTPYEALAIDVNDMGHLIVEDDGGIRHVLRAGEISVRM